MRDDAGSDVSRMGAMSVEILDASRIGESGVAVVRWSISRDGKRFMGGVSTQMWAVCMGKLRIVLEHAS